ncbi:MAG: aminopeptidase P family protein [Ferrimicrobium sp.]
MADELKDSVHTIPAILDRSLRNLPEDHEADRRATRIDRLLDALALHNPFYLLIQDPANIRYLIGFSGSSGVLLIRTGQEPLLTLCTDGRYALQAAQEAHSHGLANLEIDTTPWRSEAGPLDRVVRDRTTLLVEPHQLSLQDFELIGSIIGKDRIAHLANHLALLRQQKDPREIKAMAKAAQIADSALYETLGKLKEEPTEQELAGWFEYHLRRLGAENASFATIVASGSRSALPHGHPTQRVIREGDVVVFDYGATVEGYHSDATRTIVVGSPTPMQHDTFDLVLEAQLAGIEAIVEGGQVSAVEASARKVLRDAGEEAALTHGVGHGVGLEIHENPYTSQANGVVFANGFTVTVEPGLYYEGRYGMRIEDLFAVIDGVATALSSFPHGLSNYDEAAVDLPHR